MSVNAAAASLMYPFVIGIHIFHPARDDAGIGGLKLSGSVEE